MSKQKKLFELYYKPSSTLSYFCIIITLTEHVVEYRTMYFSLFRQVQQLLVPTLEHI